VYELENIIDHRGVPNQNSDSEGSQTGDCLERTEFREMSEICKTGIRQLLRSPYDSGRKSSEMFSTPNRP
jgi:hypothetical protein